MTTDHLPVRVIMSTPEIRKTTNPYIVQLVDSVGDHVDVQLFSWRSAIFGKYDVLHVHWPEIFTRASSAPRVWARRALTVALQTRLAVSRTALVRTAHNERPHESKDSVDARILRRWDRLTTLWIMLNEHTTTATAAPHLLIPHGHYRDHFAGMPRSEAVPNRVSVVGHVRPYKGMEQLVEAVASDKSDNAFDLHVAGKAADGDLAARLRAGAAGSEHITLELEFVEDPRMVQIITHSSLVVLPYRELHNSGVALLALSLDRPVLVPDNDITRALAEEVGEGWILRMTSTDLPAEIRRALDRGIPTGSPDLGAREWPITAAQHADAYAEARSLRSR